MKNVGLVISDKQEGRIFNAVQWDRLDLDLVKCIEGHLPGQFSVCLSQN